MHLAVNFGGIPHLAKDERDMGPILGEGTRGTMLVDPGNPAEIPGRKRVLP
jgi:hypothetical protein